MGFINGLSVMTSHERHSRRITIEMSVGELLFVAIPFVLRYLFPGASVLARVCVGTVLCAAVFLHLSYLHSCEQHLARRARDRST